MPYIEQKDRAKFIEQWGPNAGLSHLEEVGKQCENAGELNYAFTCIAQSYLKEKGLRYQNINDVIGALEGAKLELYRRVASNYEDEKINLNGDVNVFVANIEDVVQLGEG